MKRGKPLRRTAFSRNRSMSSAAPKPSNKTQSMSKKRKSPKRKSKYARRERDIDYMLWVKTLPCLLAGLEGAGPCSSVVEADHAGIRGIGQKAPDNTCIPLCSTHHLDRGAHTGYFRFSSTGEKRTREWTRKWREDAISSTQALHAEGGFSFGEAVF